ncbi:rCG20554 [Rattus norvegicus]|uniref:RCG20554 n=1 Tax=Rattus norvegicus TaxID=10116 RepID=A6K5N4_RAT|nr:rCG20554 [Rattus norvegicus]
MLAVERENQGLCTTLGPVFPARSRCAQRRLSDCSAVCEPLRSSHSFRGWRNVLLGKFMNYLKEDLSSVPSTNISGLTTACNPRSRSSDTLIKK